MDMKQRRANTCAIFEKEKTLGYQTSNRIFLSYDDYYQFTRSCYKPCTFNLILHGCKLSCVFADLRRRSDPKDNREFKAVFKCFQNKQSLFSLSSSVTE